MLAIAAMDSVSGSPRAASQRRMNLISSDCELLIRAARERSSRFSVWEEISAVISTAWEWCTIMPCMNSTSASARGGRGGRGPAGGGFLGLGGGGGGGGGGW